jgi:hypothetical protein
MDTADDRNAASNVRKASENQTSDQGARNEGINPVSQDAAGEAQNSPNTERQTDETGRAQTTDSPAKPTRSVSERLGPNVATADRQNGDPGAAGSQGLVDPDRAKNYRYRWTSIQAVFVDEPRDSVQQADTLVEELMHDLTETFGRERAELEQQWSSGEEVSTEQLRIALQRYRTFFEQLLSA